MKMKISGRKLTVESKRELNHQMRLYMKKKLTSRPLSCSVEALAISLIER